MFDTLEQAQDHIVTLNEQITTLTGERDTLSQDNESLRNEVESLRTLNQKYFNKLMAQEQNPDNEPEQDDVPTCEDFALTIKI